MTKIALMLFITGQTLRSQAAVSNLRRIFQEVMPDQYALTIVDVLERPEVAERMHILATPTLIKTNPQPARRIVGDLSDKGQVLLWLGLQDYLD